MLLLFWVNLHRVHSGLFPCRRYGFSKQPKQEKVRLPPTSAPSETSLFFNISMVLVQVDARKTPASGLPPVPSAGTEVSEEDELQEAEEVGRLKSRGRKRCCCPDWHV